MMRDPYDPQEPANLEAAAYAVLLGCLLVIGAAVGMIGAVLVGFLRLVLHG